MIIIIMMIIILIIIFIVTIIIIIDISTIIFIHNLDRQKYTQLTRFKIIFRMKMAIPFQGIFGSISNAFMDIHCHLLCIFRHTMPHMRLQNFAVGNASAYVQSNL